MVEIGERQGQRVGIGAVQAGAAEHQRDAGSETHRRQCRATSACTPPRCAPRRRYRTGPVRGSRPENRRSCRDRIPPPNRSRRFWPPSRGAEDDRCRPRQRHPLPWRDRSPEDDRRRCRNGRRRGGDAPSQAWARRPFPHKTRDSAAPARHRSLPRRRRAEPARTSKLTSTTGSTERGRTVCSPASVTAPRGSSGSRRQAHFLPPGDLLLSSGTANSSRRWSTSR